jgi:methionyl-tRNA formyltransferase
MRVVYFGTSEFAEEPLRRLLAGGHRVLALVTQPDRPKGRGRTLSAPAIKAIAERSGLEVDQPDDPNSEEFVKALRELGPDAIIVTAYAHKLGTSLLEVPKHGCINIHPSLLPLYRGAAPVNWAIINGERMTGVTIIRMNERFDAGEILMQESVDIGDEETAGELSLRLSRLGSELLLSALERIEEGTIEAVSQDEKKASRAPRISRSDCQVNWSRSAVEITNLVRGLNPKPGAFTIFRRKIVKLARARALSRDVPGEPGEIVAFDEGIEVATGKGVASLLILQPEGGREVSWIDFKNGMKPQTGEKFEREDSGAFGREKPV